MKKCWKWLKKNNEIILITFAAVTLLLTYLQLRQNAKATKDMYLTGVWNDIMQESIEHPDFTDRSKTLTYSTSFDSTARLQYECYVRWIGGFIEDLYAKEYRKEKWFYYDPWIDNMLDTHQTWFINNMQYYVHTKDFHKRLEKMMKRKPNKELKATDKSAS